MKIHRFIGDFKLQQNELEVGGEIAHQIIKVLKLEIGEKIELCDGKGVNALCKIKSLGKNSLMVEIEKIGIDEEENKKVSLFCAVLKKENFELVVQKATECGVDKIIPIITARTVKTGLNIERLQKIAKEASEQSGRSTVPEISEPVSFEESLKQAKGVNIFFDISGEVLKEKNNSIINIWIGPEGGWIPEEIHKAKSAGFKIASLGKNILRGETAAIIATYLISN
jgi:16S rRNA (uracil1498-N3)-methyltransferase